MRSEWQWNRCLGTQQTILNSLALKMKVNLSPVGKMYVPCWKMLRPVYKVNPNVCNIIEPPTLSDYLSW